MQCLKPIHIEDPHNPRTRMWVPCGRCAACLSNKANDWVTRLRAETQYSSSAYFITLTYADPWLPRNKKGLPGFSLRDMQLFLKRLRHMVPDRLRYYYVCEYGDPDNTFRPHYHLVLWNWPPEEDLLTACAKCWIDSHGRMMSIWLPEQVKPLTIERIIYVTKYIHKRQEVPPGYDKPFMRCSRRPGIGAALLTDKTVDFYRSVPSGQVYIDGQQYYMPRYFKDKIYDSPELKLALNSSKICYINTKLDKDTARNLRRLGAADLSRSKLVTRVDRDTGEIYQRVIQERSKPVGILEQLTKLGKLEITKRELFDAKSKEKIRKSYNF